MEVWANALLVGEVKFGVQSRICSGKWNACADKRDELRQYQRQFSFCSLSLCFDKRYDFVKWVSLFYATH